MGVQAPYPRDEEEEEEAGYILCVWCFWGPVCIHMSLAVVCAMMMPRGTGRGI